MNSHIKHREIQFDALHPDAHQAQSAMLRLADIKGIEGSIVQTSVILVVSYDIHQITFDEILDELSQNGFHIYNSLLAKLKQALYNYTEQTERANLAVNQNINTRNVFMKQYQRKPHGCRDQRPKHWRHYL